MAQQWSLPRVISLISVVVLLLCGAIFGKIAERRHFKSIIRRELEFNSLPAIASRYPPNDPSYQQYLVSGSVVVASDYFKSFIAGLINIFGGAVTPFESLLDRGRREAMLRMKADAKNKNADLVFNVKLETSRIQSGKNSHAIEVFAYGTALVGNSPVSSAVMANESRSALDAKVPLGKTTLGKTTLGSTKS